MGPKSLEAELAGGRGAETGTALVEGFDALWAASEVSDVIFFAITSSEERASPCDDFSMEG